MGERAMKLAMIIPSVRFYQLRLILNHVISLKPPPDIVVLIVPDKFIRKLNNVIQKLDNVDVKFIILTQQRGLVEARNKGIVAAINHGADLIWLFEDDTLVLNKNIINIIKVYYLKYTKEKNRRIGIIFGYQELKPVDYIERPLQYLNTELTRNSSTRLISLLHNIFLNIHGFNGLPYLIPVATLVLTKESIQASGLFYEGFKKEAEWSEPDLINRILNNGLIAIRLKILSSDII
ncbi:glycosyltransferase family 2 protein [Aeropyrum camini]|uniref:glycosyltransferase family 2 protein n=1 Tax=Aeropyrum camini TaxID=229980 RepID=UPI0012E1288F|nr:hypothetical protein [Aeropyrum camini]